jgi:hypothetical protein
MLLLLDDKLAYKRGGGEIVWDVAIKDLVLVAEYTTDEGPMIDDYFLVFWSLEKGQLCEMKCSFYADNAIETMETLLKRLNASTLLGLAASAEWNSRILWPAELAEKPYFEKVELVPETFKARISKAMFGPSFEFPGAPAVRAYLQGCIAGPA